MSAAAVWLLGSNWRAVVGLKPDELVEPMRPEFASLAPNDLERIQPGVTFMTGLFGDKLTARLVDENGVLLHEWPIDFFAEKRDKIYPYEALIHGAYLYENGDILINLDQKGLYRVDACGRIKWRNAAGSHHSIDVDEDGFIWTPVDQAIYSDKRIFPGQFSIDRIAKFDPETGDAIEVVDLVDAFVKSGAEGLVSGEFSRTRDVLHVNDVEILDSSMAPAFPMFSAGDILVSSRQRNAVFVLDRETRFVKWMRAGASQFQHDPDFRADGTITVFDNRGSAIASEKNRWLGDRGGSRIIALRPDAFEYSTLYQSDARNAFYTPRRGKHQILDNGDILITETDAGRVFETTPNGEVVWQYMNRYSADEVGWLMTADRYPSGYARIGEDCPTN